MGWVFINCYRVSSALLCFQELSLALKLLLTCSLRSRNRFGTCDTFSAWIVSYMIEKRDSPAAASRYQLAGLWGGTSHFFAFSHQN